MQFPQVSSGVGMQPTGRTPQEEEMEKERKRQQGLQIAQLILGSLPVVGGLLGGITKGVGMATEKKPSAPAVPLPVGGAVNDPNYFRNRYDPRYYAS